MSEEKELTLDLLNEIDEENIEQREVIIKIKKKDGYVDAKLKVDDYFRKDKIRACVKELIQSLDSAKIYMQEDEDSQSIYKLWLILLLTKHFSTLEIPRGFKKQLAVLEKLINTEVLLQIFSEFKVEEIKKVVDEIEQVLTIATTKITSYESLFEEVENQRKTKKEEEKNEQVIKELLTESIEKFKTKK